MSNFPLAGTNPKFPSMVQGFNRLGVANPFSSLYSPEAQATWEKQRAEATKTGPDAGLVSLLTLVPSPLQREQEYQYRLRESELANQRRREDIAALIEQKRAFDEEKAKRDFTYGMFASIPQAITQASTAAAAMKLAAGASMQESGRNILSAYANMQLPSTPMYQPQKYFG